MNWVKVTEELPENNFIKEIKVEGKKFCLIKEEDNFYVVQNTCPHAGGILSGGWCSNGHIVCPIHRWEYNLENGRGASGQGDYIDIYPVEKRADGLYIGLKESLWKKLWS
ncbi:nitrite reductase/ring-hydroxylating ferredoxin subunit [Pedobacter sp. UYP24]